MAGKRIFRKEVAEELIKEMRAGMVVIEQKGTFATEAERERVLKVHRDGIAKLERRVERNANDKK